VSPRLISFLILGRSRAVLSRLRSLRESLPRVYSANWEKKFRTSRNGTISRVLSHLELYLLINWIIIQLQREAPPYPRLRLSKRTLQMYGGWGGQRVMETVYCVKEENFSKRKNTSALRRCQGYNHFPKNCRVNHQFHDITVNVTQSDFSTIELALAHSTVVWWPLINCMLSIAICSSTGISNKYILLLIFFNFIIPIFRFETLKFHNIISVRIIYTIIYSGSYTYSRKIRSDSTAARTAIVDVCKDFIRHWKFPQRHNYFAVAIRRFVTEIKP